MGLHSRLLITALPSGYMAGSGYEQGRRLRRSVIKALQIINRPLISGVPGVKKIVEVGRCYFKRCAIRLQRIMYLRAIIIGISWKEFKYYTLRSKLLLLLSSIICIRYTIMIIIIKIYMGTSSNKNGFKMCKYLHIIIPFEFKTIIHVPIVLHKINQILMLCLTKVGMVVFATSLLLT